MAAQQIFDLFRRDVLAAANDDLFDAPGDAHITALIYRRLIAGVQPAVGVNRFRGRLAVVVVAPHHIVTATTKLAGDIRGARVAGRRIDDLDFDFGQRPPKILDACRGDHFRAQLALVGGIGEAWEPAGAHAPGERQRVRDPGARLLGRFRPPAAAVRQQVTAGTLYDRPDPAGAVPELL